MQTPVTGISFFIFVRPFTREASLDECNSSLLSELSPAFLHLPLVDAIPYPAAHPWPRQENSPEPESPSSGLGQLSEFVVTAAAFLMETNGSVTPESRDKL